MIKEAYCSFEVAKLLKEKGFDAECRAAYTNYGKLFTTQIQQYITNVICSKGALWDCVAPTHQTAMAWLREVHNIFINVERDNQYFQGREVLPISKHDIDRGHKPEYYGVISDELSNTNATNYYNSYEEAVEAALIYALEKLIK